ncbi:class I SAM-dependent methyltransferase [Microlunatus spumicola]|uniref:Class I SAM-dependent methyltransferase n=1 Tax=Microlunatus spumicola TaxID=81499 RepID=A0ABP6XSY5_9ACTN
MSGARQPGHGHDPATDELRDAHDVLAAFYVERLTGALEASPRDRSVLDLFAALVTQAGLGTEVADVGCGTGRLEPYLAFVGLRPSGVDLSREMVRVARRDQPGFTFEVADLRHLPYADASLPGVVCWYSLMYLPPDERPAALAELARVVRPGGHLVTAWKLGDDSARRGGLTTGLGIAFDVWWLSAPTMEHGLTRAGFETVFWAGRPATDEEDAPSGYLVVRRTGSTPAP